MNQAYPECKYHLIFHYLNNIPWNLAQWLFDFLSINIPLFWNIWILHSLIKKRLFKANNYLIQFWVCYSIQKDCMKDSTSDFANNCCSFNQFHIFNLHLLLCLPPTSIFPELIIRFITISLVSIPVNISILLCMKQNNKILSSDIILSIWSRMIPGQWNQASW